MLGEILASCRRMLHPNGRLVMTVRPYRHAGRLINLPSQLEQLAANHGLELCDRHAALLCRLDGGRVVPRASFFQLQIQRSHRIPRMLIIAHEDVLIFKPAGTRLSSRKPKQADRR